MIDRLEHLLQFGEGEPDRLLTELSPDVDGVHAHVERTRPDQGVRRDEIVESIRLHRPELLRSERRLELEHAGGATTGKHAVHRRIIQRDVLDPGVFDAGFRVP
jgi:hypothetical protein